MNLPQCIVCANKTFNDDNYDCEVQEQSRVQVHQHHPNRVMTYRTIGCTTFLFVISFISALNIPSSSFGLPFKDSISHFHHNRFGQFGFISSSHPSSLLDSPLYDEDGTRRSGTGSASSGSSSSSSSSYHLIYDKHRIEPYFDTSSLSRNITVSEGSAAVYLPCRVHQLGDRTVSWMRRKDLHVLTVGKFTYTSDQRFQAVHMENTDDWTLQIRYPKREDASIYECQVSTLPKMSLFVNLNVIVAKSHIVGGPTLYINSGGMLSLVCIVNETPGPPDYIFWYHNGEVINYDSPRGIKVQTEKSAQTTSKLIIDKAMPNDSGNYSCSPANAEPAHIAVHIHGNGNPAASIQHGKRSARNFITSNASHLFHSTINIGLGLPAVLFIYITILIHHNLW